jgi:hypothetical protein
MRPTDSEDTPTSVQDATSVRLRTSVYDALAVAKGYTGAPAQARWHGIARSNMYRLRSGGRAELATAMRMAADLGVAVEVIWERVSA